MHRYKTQFMLERNAVGGPRQAEGDAAARDEAEALKTTSFMFWGNMHRFMAGRYVVGCES